jgi:hypothetical protein
MLKENWIRMGSFTDAEVVAGALGPVFKLTFTPQSENDDVSVVWLRAPHSIWRLLRALKVATPWPSFAKDPDAFLDFLRVHVLARTLVVRRQTASDAVHPTDDFFPMSIFDEPQETPPGAAPASYTLDAQPVWVLHSPYPDGTWRGLEKCSATRDGPLVFGAREGAEEVLRNMGEVASYFRIVEVCIVMPCVRKPLDSATYARVLDALDRGEPS